MNMKQSVCCASAVVFAVVAVLSVSAADPFRDAQFWLRGVLDGDASGTMNATNEFPNALRMDDPTHWAHKLNLHSKSTNCLDKTKNYPLVVDEDVVSPFYGTSIGPRKCIRFRQLECNGGINRELLSMSPGASKFAVTNTTGWSVYLRVKPEGGTTLSGTSWGACLSRFCHYWSSDGSGVKINISGSPEYGQWSLLFGSEAKTFTTMKATGTTALQTNKWVDLIFTVSNYNVRVYSFREGGSLYEGSQTIANPQAITNHYVHSITIGGHEDASGGGANFVGLWHDLAFWQRPLTDVEARQILTRDDTVSRPVQLGVVNDSSGEFRGTGSAPATAGTDGEWLAMPPEIVPGGSATIKFTPAANCQNANQTLLIAATSSSAEKDLSVTLNGRAVGRVRVLAGKTVKLVVKADFFVSGENTLVLVSDATGGTVRFDALTLAGGWQYGSRNAAANDLASQNGAKNFYIGNTNCIQSNIGMKSLLHCGNKQTNTNSVMHVSFAPGMEKVGRFLFSTRVGAGATEQRWGTVPGIPTMTFKIYVNKVYVATFSNQLSGWKDVNIMIPAELFDYEKDNTIELVNFTPLWFDPTSSEYESYKDPSYGVYAWVSFDFFRLEPLDYNGTLVIFR